MLKVRSEGRFNKDVKRLKKSGPADFDKLKTVIKLLENEKQLDIRYRAHKLSSNWKDHMECHIEPDWLLIYRIDQAHEELILVRTGTHSDLFG